MGLPSKRRTSRSKRERASHFALKSLTVAKCEECKANILPHHACSKCGFYKGRRAINVEKRTLRAQKKTKANR